MVPKKPSARALSGHVPLRDIDLVAPATSQSPLHAPER